MKTIHRICHYHDEDLLSTNPANDDASYETHISYISCFKDLPVFRTSINYYIFSSQSNLRSFAL